ncbi:MAG: FAD:protein FMN transferase [Candidatus Delongbacteria bacterium]|nr:FAD:protein FMN transferase [Candidatus Delongbacteria bacterium]
MNKKVKITSSFVEFSTDVNISLFGISMSDTSGTSDAISFSRGIFSYFNSEMNPYLETSSLSLMNSAEPMVKTEIPNSLRQIIRISRNLHKYTDKYFNVAVLPVVELWGFYTGTEPVKPEDNMLKETLKISDLDLYNFENDSFFVSDKRCRIGLGGIAKGYAVDSVAHYLLSEGYNDFIVEAGGDMIVRSKKPKTIGIKHPRLENELIDTIYVSSGAVATSGDYEKYIEADGQRYCHIINPYTGYGTSDIISVTVISEKTYLSDAFATAAFAMGREKAEYILEKNKLSALIYYYGDGKEINKKEINMGNYKKPAGYGL